MRLDWFHPRKLARRLSAGEVSNREVGYLMLSNLLFSSVIFYGAFTWANPPWTLASVLEFVCVVVVTIVGFTKVYDAAGGDKNDSFAVLFNCLSFGIWFWVTVIVWVVYWAVLRAVQYGVINSYSLSNESLGGYLVGTLGGFEWIWTFLAALLWQALFFTWLARVIPRVRGDA